MSNAPENPEKRPSAAETYKRLGPMGPLAILAAVMPIVGGFALLGTLNIVGPWLRDQGDMGVVIYASAFAVLAGLALLPTYAQAILGGWAFGFATGYPAAMAGFFGGALLGYAIGRGASRDRAMVLLREHPKWIAVRDALVGGEQGAGFFRTLGIVTLLRLPPNSPFALTNMVMAAVKVPRIPFALGTLIGMAPRTGIAVWAASTIQGEINKQAVSQSRPDWMVYAAIGVSVVVLVIIGAVAKRAIDKVTASAARAT
ncbi:MAG: TVP38/TMEM64 family protein [Phycisphaeraceae bacterium]|nr:TVP38/TMEM64 family protein [Phycisphaeraceae bacterium]MCW5754787.1 TVP38/TMEM64 family protein [Phycisphaeraceae bacterium]